jgi:hypothetical protein
MSNWRVFLEPHDLEPELEFLLSQLLDQLLQFLQPPPGLSAGMSKWTSYCKIYRPDVRPCPRLSHGRGFIRRRIFIVHANGKNRVRANVVLMRPRRCGSARTQVWGGPIRISYIKGGVLLLFSHFQPIPVE